MSGSATARGQVLLAAVCFGTSGTAQALGPGGAPPSVGAVRIMVGALGLWLVARALARRSGASATPGGAAHAHSAPSLQGPLPAPMARRAGMHRMQLVLTSSSRRELHALLDAALPLVHALPEARKVRWSLDVDPLDLY